MAKKSKEGLMATAAVPPAGQRVPQPPPPPPSPQQNDGPTMREQMLLQECNGLQFRLADITAIANTQHEMIQRYLARIKELETTAKV